MDLIISERPEVICLQECPSIMSEILSDRQYYVSFTPLTLRECSDPKCQEGILLASLLPHHSAVHYYRTGIDELRIFKKEDYYHTMKKAVLYADVGGIHVATTHFTWTPEGSEPNEYQYQEMQLLLQYLDRLPPHVLCGDFNIPRGYNPIYEQYLLPRYVDAVPAEYTSSLDPTAHRMGNVPEKQHLFTQYMVDYIFTQKPLSAQDVRLIFEVSDHAAVVGEILDVT